jgi:hypothetical protein
MRSVHKYMFYIMLVFMLLLSASIIIVCKHTLSETTLRGTEKRPLSKQVEPFAESKDPKRRVTLVRRGVGGVGGGFASGSFVTMHQPTEVDKQANVNGKATIACNPVDKEPDTTRFSVVVT